MWYERFLDAINASWLGDAVERRVELIKETDPQHIYVENIRTFFRVPYRMAKFLCDVAVREGVFVRRIGYLCPKDKNVIRYAQDPTENVEPIVCQVCEAEGEEEYEFAPADLQTIEIYSVSATHLEG